MNRVSLVQAGGDVEAAVRRGVDLVGGLNLERGWNVVVKPNICNCLLYTSPSPRD